MKRFLLGMMLMLLSQIAYEQNVKPISSSGFTIVLPIISKGDYYNFYSTESTTGILGIGASIFHKFKNNTILLGYESPVTHAVLFPPKGGYFKLGNSYFECSYRYTFLNRVEPLIGLNYLTRHFHSYSDLLNVPDKDYLSTSLGLTLGLGLKLAKYSSFVLTYRPVLYNFNNSQNKSILSCAIKFDIKVLKK
ncbi:MAG: hypothetical protein KGO81_14890 [Bacteroidota bacterium]|nr:hypothetical protein [Bacteroidota bacterium]